MTESQLQGTVTTLTYRNEENGYTVARISSSEHHGRKETVIGYFPALEVGEYGTFTGEWVNDKRWGKQFSAKTFESQIPDNAKGIELLLSKGKFKGIGPKFAKRIVAKFGDKTIDIIENSPDKLKQIEGIGRKKIEQVKKAWKEKKELKNILLFLAEYHIPFRLAHKVYGKYGENSIDAIKNDPYRLIEDIPGIGFITADQIGLSIGIDKNSTARIKGAINHILQKAVEDGHTYLPKNDVIANVAELIESPADDIEHSLNLLKEGNRVIIDGGEMVYLRWLYSREMMTAQRIVKILSCVVDDDLFTDIEGELSRIEQETEMQYSPMQRKAITEALRQKIVIITGGPGTGKTTIIKALIRLFLRKKLRVRLTAPTGRAAKRMEEACNNYPSSTIHRLLEYNPGESRFIRNPGFTLDTDVVIVDETSMIDIPLMCALLSGVPDEIRVVFVGDSDQLPSVGPGSVLKDMIASNSIPVVMLDTIFRQAETSDIIVRAHEINTGDVSFMDNTKSSNFFFMAEDDNEKIPGKIADLVRKRLPEKYGFDPVRDIQVLTSMYKGDTGALNLNSVLQKELITGGKSVTRGERTFIVGDKVMQVRNNYNKDVYNGDIGFIERVDEEDDEIIIRYDGRRIEYAVSELDQVVHAYAVTVHKSQGSEYKAVVMPVTTQHFIMLQRNLLYTAVTRAKEMLVLIGTIKAFKIAVNNNKTAERYTFLEERLRFPDK
ncbi:MAG: ATP-dependent RecD-like DNA helicase, partial [bacterium]|nr:ATP-dependent RecD-like DNA helicase [bacterium]